MSKQDSLKDLLIDHDKAVNLPRHTYRSHRSIFDSKKSYLGSTKRNQHDEAIIQLGYDTGGFPVGKTQLISIFNRVVDEDFYELRDQMRKAIQTIEHDNMTQEQVSSAAHICAVIAYKSVAPNTTK